jgi:alanine racemase
MEPSHRAEAVVDLGAIRRNTAALRRLLDAAAQLMAVVKADAYGHGAVPVARAALEAGATALGVATVDEGIELRRAGIGRTILVLGPSLPREAPALVEHGLEQMVADLDAATALAQEATGRRQSVGLHLKVDTGMGRVGVPPAEAVPAARRLLALSGVRLAGVMTHFADADEGEAGGAPAQLAAFREVLGALRGAGIDAGLAHAANSAGILTLPASHLDLARAGLALYGCHPSRETAGRLRLEPALTFRTRVAFVKEVAGGASIGYGRTFTAPGRMIVATLPVGYADGFARGHSNRGAALIGGRRAPIVGRVCMDMTMVDVSATPGVRVGDEAVLYGAQGHEAIPVDEVASLLGTISYEILCAIGKRVRRSYVER